MVKSILSVSHRGLRDWMIQRLSAILMAVYFLGLTAYFLFHPFLSFYEWHDLFARASMKIATMIVLTGLLYHAWIGMWTIWTDYVKCFVVRAALHVLVLLILSACFFWGLLILWSV